VTDEGVPGSKVHATGNARRVAAHRLRQRARSFLLAKLLEHDEVKVLADALTERLANASPELANALANDPLLLANVSQPRELTLANTLANAPQVSSGELAHAPAPLAHLPSEVPPQTPLPSSPQPAPTGLALRPSDGTLRSAQGVEGAPGRRDPHFEALADALYPGLEGEYAGMDDRARGQCARALQQIKRAEDKRGVPDWQQPERIKRAVANWPNVKGSEPITPTKVAGNWTALTAGIQVGGRDNGTVRHHHQYLNESATVKHPSRMGLE
jgi:hypothetical protein